MRNMKIVALGAAGLLLAGCANTSAAVETEPGSAYPEKPITLIVAFDPGGGSDIGARLLAEELEKELGATIVVENRPGAGGQIGYTAIAQADPDGYTFGLTTIPGIIVSALDETREATYTAEDFAPSALQVVDPLAVAVAPDSPYDTLEELLEAAEDAPGEITAATNGIGTTEHFGLLLLNQAADVDIRPVHFADGAAQATTAFLGGNVQVLLSNVGDMKAFVDNGTAKVLAVLAEQRSPYLPDVETSVEAGYDVAIGSSRGYAFPAGTPQEIVDEMSDAIGAVMADKDFQKRMADLGLQPVYMNSVEYTEFWNEQTALLGDLVDLVHE